MFQHLEEQPTQCRYPCVMKCYVKRNLEKLQLPQYGQGCSIIVHAQFSK